MRKSLIILFIALSASCKVNYYICTVDQPVVLFSKSNLDSTSQVCQIPVSKQVVAYKNGRKSRKVIYGNTIGYIKSHEFYYETPCSTKDLSFLTFNNDSTYSYKGTRVSPFPDNSPTYSSGGSVSKPTSSGGTVHVKGYYRKDGTYVRPHTRSAPKRKG